MNKRDEPRVSVIMGTLYPSRNTELLRRSVDSIRAQSYGDWEFLICDDGSGAGASRWLDRCARADPRIRLLRPGNKLDLAAKLNVCLREARGSYIARMDDDDLSRPERLEKQVAFLDAHMDVAFVGCSVDLWCRGMPAGQRQLPARPGVEDFLLTQPFIHPALVFRKEALQAVGGYSERKRQVLCEDYDLLLRLYEKGYRGANLPEPLLVYTVPADPREKRKLRHRWNETVTRFERFRDLGLLPGKALYVVKPLAVGLLPQALVERMKRIC